MKRFEEFTYQDAVDALAARKAERVGDAYDVNQKMAEAGDFWQDGSLWVGPRGSDEAWNAAIKAVIARQFVPGGAVLEAIGNFVRGLLGKQANIQAVPLGPVEEGSDEANRLKAEADEIIEALSVWWDRVRLWQRMREVAARSRWAGWGAIRLRIPPGKLEREEGEDGVVTRLPRFDNFAEALSAVDLSAPEPVYCAVIEHPDTLQRAAIFHYTGDDKRGRVELWYEDGEETVFRLLVEGGEEAEEEARFPWGGRIPVAEMDGDVLLTEPVRRSEAALAFALTNTVRVGETAGFRERYTTNAEPSGIWLPTPPGNLGPHRTMDDGEGGILYFHPLPRSLGAGITTDLIGVWGDAEGETRASPGVTIADPVDLDYATKGAEFWRRRVLELCHQGHLAMTTRGEASGYAYEQSRAAFIGDLDAHVDPAERALTETLEAAVAMAESMMVNPPGILERFRLIVTITPDPGPVSPELAQETRDNVKAGLLSRSTAMAKIGVDDVAAELDAIEQDPQSQIGAIKERVAIMLQLKAAEPDMPLVQAAIVAGWDEDEARRLFTETDAAAVQARQEREAIAAALRGGQGEPDPREAAA